MRSDGYSALDDFERKYCRPNSAGRTLIVGSHIYRDKPDRRKRYPNAIGWDMLEGAGVDRVIDLEEALPDDAGTFAHIECMSVIEHSSRPWKLAENVELLLVQNGTLYVTAPFVWRVHGYPDDYWRFTANGIRKLFPQIEWIAVMYANWELTHKVKRIEHQGFWHFPRTDVVAFGRKP